MIRSYYYYRYDILSSNRTPHVDLTFRWASSFQCVSWALSGKREVPSLQANIDR